MTSQTSAATVPRFELRHRLALALEWANVNPEGMASEIGRAPTTIRNYLSGRTDPSRGVVTAWAVRCGVDRDWLWDGEAAGPDDGPGRSQYPPWDSNPEPAGNPFCQVIDLRRAA